MIEQKRLADFLGTVVLILIIACHEFFYVRLISWLLLGFICLRNRKFAVNSVFFFGSFFMSSGFFQNSLVTVKHFHLALAILFFVSLIQWKQTLDNIKKNWRASFILIFWIALIAISTFSLLRIGGEFEQNFRTTGNLLLTVLCAWLFFLLIKKEDVIPGLGFLVFGACIRAFLSILFLWQIPGPYLKEAVLYNNHLGFYFSMALLYFLSFITVIKNRFLKQFLMVAFFFLFYVFLLTGSRTGYVGFFGGLFSFAVIQKWLQKKGFPGIVPRTIGLTLSSVFLGSVSVLLGAGYLFPDGYIFPIISSRLWMTLNLFTPNQWKIALADKQNFGFLGYYRLEQFQILSEILKQHPFFGIGLVKRVTDFHSLYLTLLGATGITGLTTFIFFCISWMHKMFHSMVSDDGNSNLFRMALMSCMVCWLCYSIAETFFLQFNIWIMIVSGIALSKSVLLERKLV